MSIQALISVQAADEIGTWLLGQIGRGEVPAAGEKQVAAWTEVATALVALANDTDAIVIRTCPFDDDRGDDIASEEPCPVCGTCGDGSTEDRCISHLSRIGP